MRPDKARRTIRLSLVVVLFFTMVSSAAAREPSEDLINHVKGAVVIITTYDRNGKALLQGSGFFVASNQLVTAWHVVKTAHHALIKTANGKTFPIHGVVAVNEQSDLALLETGGESSGCATLAIAETIPGEGDEVIVVSNPKGASWKVTKGTTEASWDFQGVGEVLSITAKLAPGSSGGPVVNRLGRVVGVAAMHAGSAGNLNFAVPAVLIKSLTPGPLREFPYTPGR
jgi:S1-C subfamily serine protease